MTEQRNDAAPSHEPTEADRESEIRKWQANASRPGIASTAKNSPLTGAVLFAVVAAAVAGGWFLMHHGSDTSGIGADEGFSLASTAPVKPLAVPAAAASQPETSAPVAASAIRVVPGIDHGGAQDGRRSYEQIHADALQREADQQRRKDEALKNARIKSALFATSAGGEAPAPASAASGVAAAKVTSSDANDQFLADASNREVQTVKAFEFRDLDYKILQDRIIDCIEAEPMDSDLPGSVTCMTLRDEYGETGQIPLMRAGTIIHGTYNTKIAQAQNRMFVVWQRAVTPSPHKMGIYLDSEATDQMGMAGVAGDVDNHWFQIFGTAAAVSLISAGAQNVGVNSAQQYNSAAAYRTAIGESASNTASTILGQSINIKPTITTQPGRRIQILVNRDLDFTDVFKHANAASPARDGVLYLN